MRPFFSSICVSRKAGESRRGKQWFFVTQQNEVQSGRTISANRALSGCSPSWVEQPADWDQSLDKCHGATPLCFVSTENESWAEVPRGRRWEAVSGKPQSRHCPLPQDLPYRCTCCKCLSPFSLAGLLSDPLLLPDCSFSFSSAVAYANVSCQRLKHKKSACAVAAGPRKTTLHLTSGGGAFMSTSGAGGATLNDPHCCPSRRTTHLLLFHRKIVSSVLTHF